MSAGPHPPPTTLFSLPLAIPRPDAERTDGALQRLFHRQLERPIDVLTKDLHDLEAFFAPTRREASLRREIDRIQNDDVHGPFLQPPIVLVEGGLTLITPEGRLAIDVLGRALEGTDSTVVIPASEVSWAESEARRYWRTLAVRRIERVLRLREGEDERLRVASVGLVLLLLVNRSTAPDRAVIRPTNSADRQAVDQALASPVQVFADVLDPRGQSKRSSEHFSLYGGYALTEARRRLGPSLIQQDGLVYVAPGAERSTTDFLARDLAKREGLNEANLSRAVDALVDAYHANLPALAAARLAFERPGRTQEIRSELLAAFRKARQSS